MAFKTGDKVQYEVKPIIGTILGAKFDEDSNILYLVEYEDKNGDTQQRYFLADELVAG